MKMNKNMRYVIWSIFVFLSIISLHAYPSSHSKYIDRDDEALAYNANLSKLYNSTPLGIYTTPRSTYQVAYLSFSIPRNSVVTEKMQDVYEIIVPSVCTLNDITSSGVRNGNKVTFQSVNTSTIDVTLRCDVNKISATENGKAVFRVPTIEIREQIGEDKLDFRYMEGSFVLTQEEYFRRYPKPDPTVIMTDTKLIMSKDVTDKYSTFTTWITNYANKYGYSTEVLKYIKNKYPDEASILNMSLTLPGFRATYDETSKQYTYEIRENFVGYARTASSSSRAPEFMYFSTEDEGELQKAFELYLKNYATEDAMYQLILDYVKSFDSKGISYVVLPKSDGTYQTINGMIYNPETKQLRILNNIKDYAYLLTGTPIRISFLYYPLMHPVFYDNISTVYGDIVSKTAENALKNNYDIYLSVTKNGYQTLDQSDVIIPKSFRDYFIQYDKEFNYYLLVDVKSLAGNADEEQCNYVILDKLLFQDDVKISFNNTSETALEVTVSHTSKDKILEVIIELNKYFGSEIKEEDLTFTTLDDNSISVVYTITKEIL